MSNISQKDLIDLIKAFRQQFGSGRPTMRAHFVPSRHVPKNTVYVMDLGQQFKPLSLLFEEPPNINLEKDYAVAVHPETLEMIRSEFNQIFAHLPPLTDNEIAVIVANGALADKLPRGNGGIRGLDTTGS